ncbi:MAG TPA: formyltransferase family protein, partial [Longilinea sp.]|nr:formyltransferase family protein [Longilinea sp.]
SRLVVWLVAQEPGLQMAAVIVRTPWDIDRIRGEWQRDGARLLRKVRDKLVLQSAVSPAAGEESLSALAARSGLPNSTLADLCRAKDIPCLSVKDHNDPTALALLQAQPPDVIAFTGGGMIRKALLTVSRLGVMNCHAGILPRYRGMDVVEWPALEGHPDQTGLTLQFMDEGVDTGKLLLQRRIPLRPGEDFISLRKRLEAAMPDVILEGLRGLRDGVLTPQAQEAGAGHQYYVMHPRMAEKARGCIKSDKQTCKEL